MALATFNDLSAAVNSYLKRTDVTSVELSIFLAVAEADINRRLRLAAMEKMVDLTMVGGIVALPSDFLEARAVRIGLRPLKYLAPAVSDRFDYGQPSGPGTTYTFRGPDLIVVPAESATVTLEYYAALPALSASVQTNALLARHPDIYLYRVLQEACGWAVDDNGVQKYAAMATAAIEAARKADRDMKWSGSPLQIRTIGG
jgi:hypothetical protein